MWLKIQKEEIMNAIEKCDSMVKEWHDKLNSELSLHLNMDYGMNMAAAVGAKKALMAMMDEMEPVDAE